jgi:hypothetical protein
VSFRTDTTESYAMLLPLISYTILNTSRPDAALSDIVSHFKVCIDDSVEPGVFNTDGYVNAKIVINKSDPS